MIHQPKMFLLSVYKKGMKTERFVLSIFYEKKKISFCNFAQENRGLLCFLSCLQPDPALLLADVGCAALGTLQNLSPGQGLQTLCMLHFGGQTGPVCWAAPLAAAATLLELLPCCDRYCKGKEALRCFGVTGRRGQALLKYMP